jgi:hypothetical protein
MFCICGVDEFLNYASLADDLDLQKVVHLKVTKQSLDSHYIVRVML